MNEGDEASTLVFVFEDGELHIMNESLYRQLRFEAKL